MKNIADAAYTASLFAQDLQTISLHAVGSDFDKIKSIVDDLHKAAMEDATILSEAAVANGEKVDNMSNAKNYITDYESLSDDAFDFAKAVESIKTQGQVYFDTLTSTEADSWQSVIDDLIQFWAKELNYKNAAREFGAKDYVDIVDTNDDDAKDADEDSTERFKSEILYNYGYRDAGALDQLTQTSADDVFDSFGLSANDSSDDGNSDDGEDPSGEIEPKESKLEPMSTDILTSKDDK